MQGYREYYDVQARYEMSTSSVRNLAERQRVATSGVYAPLGDRRLFERGSEAHTVLEQPGVRDHDPVVDTEAAVVSSSYAGSDVPLVHREHAPAPLGSHDPHHLLQALVA